MGLQCLHDTGSSYPITPKMDGGTYAVGVPDCVCDIGDNFTINYSADSLNVTFNAGSQAVIGGAFVRTTSLEAITLVSNSTIYLCLNIDLSKPNGQRASFVQRTASNMQSGNINGSGTSRDLLLYIVNTGANGVVSVSDKRVIRGDATSISGLGITTMSQSDYDSLVNKDANTLYFIPEE